MFYVELTPMINENTPADREPLVYLTEGGKTSTYNAEYFDTKQEAEQAFLTSDLAGEQYANYTGYFYYKYEVKN